MWQKKMSSNNFSLYAYGSHLVYYIDTREQNVNRLVPTSPSSQKPSSENILLEASQPEQLSLWAGVTSGVKADDKLWKHADWTKLESFLQSTFRHLWRMFLEAGNVIPIDSSREIMTYYSYFDYELVIQSHVAVKTNQFVLFWTDKLPLSQGNKSAFAINLSLS